MVNVQNMGGGIEVIELGLNLREVLTVASLLSLGLSFLIYKIELYY